MYINDVWTVGDVWNSQNIPKSKQRSSGFLSNVFGKSDRSLQVENSILSQQLTESQQDRKETERTLQDVIESHQQVIRRLQETQSQLKETHSQLQVSDTKLEETRSQLEETQSQLQETKVQLPHAQQKFRDSQHQKQVIVCDIYMHINCHEIRPIINSAYFITVSFTFD